MRERLRVALRGFHDEECLRLEVVVRGGGVFTTDLPLADGDGGVVGITPEVSEQDLSKNGVGI